MTAIPHFSRARGTRHHSLLLVRRPNHDQSTVGAGDGAADQNQMIVGVDLDHLQVARSDALGAVAAGHALAAFRAAATAIASVRADTAGRAVVFFDAVTGRQAREIVPLHLPVGAAALP